MYLFPLPSALSGGSFLTYTSLSPGPWTPFAQWPGDTWETPAEPQFSVHPWLFFSSFYFALLNVGELTLWPEEAK